MCRSRGGRSAGIGPVWTIIVVRTLQASAAALLLHWLLHWPFTGPHALGLWMTPLLCLYFVFVFVAPWRWGLAIQTRLSTTERQVALTFDDGPSPECTPQILDVLAAQDVQATFFVLGMNVRRYPEIIRRIVREGHTLGIHGDQHVPFVLMSAGQVRQEISASRAALTEACPEIKVHWLRPPYGFKSLTLPGIVRRMGCHLVTWNADSRDYRQHNPLQIARTALARLRPGAIILLHDGAGNSSTVEALPAILEALAARNYLCVPL
jgi:peptidoglycan/xylan/chitin deacetylase (PgdA/CDA1 family)